MPAHYKFGGSSIARTIRCLGSPAMLEKNPLPETKYARKGTEKAKHLEEFLKNEVISGITDEEWKYISTVGECIRPLVTPKSKIVCEEQVQFKKLHPTDAGCTPDIVIYEPMGKLHMIDVKGGWQFVSAEKNEQCMFNSLAVIDAYDLEPSEVWLHIIQPMHDKPMRSYKTSFKELDEFMTLLKMTVRNVEASPNQRAPGDWCQYCNKAACSAWIKEQKAQGIVVAEKAEPVAVEKLPTSQLLSIYQRAPLVKKMLEEAEAQLMERALAGEAMPDFKLVKSFGRRAWKKDIDLEKMGRMLDCASTAFLGEPEMINLTTLKKRFGKKFKTDPELLEAIESEFMTRNIGPALVPADHPGDAWDQKFDDAEGIHDLE